MKRTKWTSDLHWVREGKQDRSRKTQVALLDAAEVLFAAEGIGGATIADISAAAGCSIGAFYHHYRDKRAVQYAVFERHANEFEETVRVALEPSRWEGAGVADILLGYLLVATDNHRDFPHRLRAIGELARVEPEIQSHIVKLRVMLDSGIRALILARRATIGHDDPEVAVTFVLDQLGSMLRTRLNDGDLPSRFGSHSDDEFLREALRSVCAYLDVPGPEDLSEHT